MVYALVIVAVLAMSAGQLLLKKGMMTVGSIPQDFASLLPFLIKTFSNIYVLGAIGCVIITAIVWVLALPKAQLSVIYPLMALSYVLVAFFSFLLFKEDVTALRWVGIATICIGVVLVAQG